MDGVPGDQPGGDPSLFARLEQTIRERELAESRFRTAESRARAFLDNSADGIIVISEKGLIQSFSVGAEKMFGWTEGEVIGKNINVLMPSPFHEEHDGYLDHYRRTGERKVIGIGREVMALRKDGSQFPVDLAITDHGDGESGRFSGIIRDISDRKRANEQLRTQALLLEKIREAVILQDTNDRIIFWNHGAELLYGWEAAEVVGSFAHQLKFHSNLVDIAEAQSIANRTGEWSGTLKQKTKHGRPLTVESHWTLVRDDEGNPRGTLIINIDVTEKLRLETQLLRSQRLESIGTLAGGIAHDLNNLFTPIMLMINILKRELVNPELLQLLSTAQSSIERGSEMIRQLLSFAGGIKGDRRPVDVSALVSELKSILEHTLPKSIETNFLVEKNIWMVSGDETQLSQVLLNLCINARDAMPRGGELRISICNRTVNGDHGKLNIDAVPGPYVQFTVNDTGVGISKKIIDKIFDPFFTTKELGKGTGLGLSTAMGIVKGHGGFLNIYSEEGKGTTISIFIPALKDSTEAMVEDVGKSPRAGKGETILVVDDEDFILQTTRMTLESFGYQVVTAKDGISAIEIVDRSGSSISAVVMDMMMPGMDGIEAITRIRQFNSSMPIIASSGLHANEREESAMAAGASAFLNKPYSDEKLLECLRRVVSR